jgi:hypothetical protein
VRSLHRGISFYACTFLRELCSAEPVHDCSDRANFVARLKCGQICDIPHTKERKRAEVRQNFCKNGLIHAILDRWSFKLPEGKWWRAIHDGKLKVICSCVEGVVGYVWLSGRQMDVKLGKK